MPSICKKEKRKATTVKHTKTRYAYIEFLLIIRWGIGITQFQILGGNYIIFESPLHGKLQISFALYINSKFQWSTLQIYSKIGDLQVKYSTQISYVRATLAAEANDKQSFSFSRYLLHIIRVPTPWTQLSVHSTYKISTSSIIMLRQPLKLGELIYYYMHYILVTL